MPLPRLAQIKHDHNLRSAAARGDLALAKSCLDQGANPNGLDGLGNGALHACAGSAHPKRFEMARLLLSFGADPKAPGGREGGALHRAMDASDEKMARLLLQAGARPNARDQRGRSPLARLCEQQEGFAEGLLCATALLDMGADINLEDCQRNRPLNLAIERKRVDLALLLIERGAGVDLPGKNGGLPLHDAGYADLFEVCLALIEKGADIHAKKDGLDFFSWVARRQPGSACASALPAWWEAKILRESLKPAISSPQAERIRL